MELGAHLPLWSTIPFIGILFSIACLPLFAPRFWHHHFPKVSCAWALAFALPFLTVYKGSAAHELLHILLLDYLPFIILLWSLFTISGGVVIEGHLKGRPLTNTVFLLVGTLMASWVGTTGASMLLIRPLLKANADRQHRTHTIIFFIFLVSNIGGALTPLGDPPLFLGFLHKVPFFWTLNLLPYMGLISFLLLSLYFALDTFYYRKETHPPAPDSKLNLKVSGLHNMLLLAGIVGAVLLSGTVDWGRIEFWGISLPIQNILRDLMMIAIGILSLKTTHQDIHKKNHFSWFPIQEVAILFASIFVTIIPALAILKAGSEGALASVMKGLNTPTDYFWVAGLLSSFLDNAPTYLTFFNSALGQFFPHIQESEAVARLIGEFPHYLVAISIGAVFMGANTYIGNAPNFMVKSMAKESGVPMPSFFGYILKYSLPILGPCWVLISWLL